MNKKLLGLAIAATLSISAFSASAEDMYRGAWYAGVGANYLNTDSDLDANDGAGFYISIGKELSRSWDLQARLGHGVAGEDLNLGLGESGDFKQTTLSLDALYMFSRDKFRPFLLAGVGVADNNADYNIPGVSNGEDKTSWLAGLGLGAQYLVNDNFGFQADLRHQWSKAEVNTNGLVNGDKEETIGNTLLNIGGIFRWGAPAVIAAVAPEPAPVAPAPKCVSEVNTITLGAAKLFGYDKTNIAAEGKATLDEAAAQINENPDVSLVIVTGHTDRTGSFGYNQKLSERRAEQVGEYLIAQGVSPELISTTGRGEAVPVVECKGNRVTKALITCLAPNRRVEINAEVKKETGCN